MSDRSGIKFLTERDKQVFAASGYGTRGGFGKRPALLVIDVNYAFCGDKPEPILEVDQEGGAIPAARNSSPAVAAIKSLVDKAHGKGIPVIYTTGVRREDNWDSPSWSWKNTPQRRGGAHQDQRGRQPDRRRDRARTEGHRDPGSRSRPAFSAPNWRAISRCSAATASSSRARPPRAACARPCSTPSATIIAWRWRRRAASTARRPATPSTSAT